MPVVLAAPGAVVVERLAPAGCALLLGGDWLCPTAETTPATGCALERLRAAPQAPTPIDDGLRCSLDEGRVHCWGRNPEGGLGDGRSHESTSPVLVALSQRANQIAVGDQHACALLEDRSVWCWGENSRGALGLGVLPPCCDIQDPTRPPEYLTPQRLRSLPKTASIHALGNAACALTLRGEVYCWGENGAGELGSPASSEPLATPTRVQGLPVVTQLVMDGPSCALGAERETYCWGDGCPLLARAVAPLKIDWAKLERPPR